MKKKNKVLEKVLEEIVYAYHHPGKEEADANGNTRLAVLSDRFHMSPMKVRKLLVTAGVYEHVYSKGSENDFVNRIQKMKREGYSIEEIMEETQLSQSSVYSYLPYENSVYRADRNQELLGEEEAVSPDARRKRRQREREEERRNTARAFVLEDLSDESFWNAVREHAGEIFINSEGEQFRYKVEDAADQNAKRAETMAVQPLHKTVAERDAARISKEDVLEVLHQALERKAEGREDIAGESEDEAAVYVYPLLGYFGIVNGEEKEFMAKRIRSERTRCTCCGREAKLYPVADFEELIFVHEKLEEKRRAEMVTREKKLGLPPAPRYAFGDEKYWTKVKEEKLAAARASAAVKAFDEQGPHYLCEFCAETIYMALEKGEAVSTEHGSDYDMVPDEVLEGYVQDSLSLAECSYIDVYGEKIPAERFNNEEIALYRARDWKGEMHEFALHVFVQDYVEGEYGVSIDGREVHRLTKAGKVAKKNTGTDYEFRTFEIVKGESEVPRAVCCGMLKLEDKIDEGLRQYALRESRLPISNGVVFDGKYYGMERSGQIIPVYMGEDFPDHYMSLQEKGWTGGEHGFLIDGRVVSEEEFARMCSGMEGWQIRFQAADPSDKVLRRDEYLMPVRLNQKQLKDETIGLYNMFCRNDEFISKHDRRNFEMLFEEVLRKLKFYHENNPRGYGKLAGMEIVKVLEWVDGTEALVEKVKRAVR